MSEPPLVQEPPTWSVLTPDGALLLQVPDALEEWVRPWRPRIEHSHSCGAPRASARISLRDGFDVGPPPDGPAVLRLGSARLYVRGSGGWVLWGDSGLVRGDVDLAAASAVIRVGGGRAPAPAETSDVYCMLTVAAALLLGRMERTLVHAGGVVTPDGGAWLLIGDSRSGKSTTCATLIEHGWNYLSDDQILVARDGAAITASGWLRAFHLDAQWRSAGRSDRRVDVDSTTIGPGRPVPLAVVNGLLFPCVSPHGPTHLVPTTSAAALARLIRQSPWLMADAHVTPRVLGLCRSLAELPRFELRLGLDVYRRPDALAAVLERQINARDVA